MGKRIEYIDFIKGICIFIVVWGHSIQNLGDGNDFWANPVHEFICSFHMPIFMLVSGFFFNKSIGKPLMQNVTRRFKQLILPCFGWSLVLVAINIGYMLYAGIIPSPVGTLKSLFMETFTRFWFLRSVFICFTLAIVSMKIFKKDTAAFVISLLLFLALPDNGRLHLDKFMYPFFWMGYFMHKYIDVIMKHRGKLLIASLILFAILLPFYQKEDYIYITGMSMYDYLGGKFVCYLPWERLPIICYRYLIGFAGSLFIFLLLQRIYRPHFHAIEKVGTYTLGIYTIHILIEGNVLSRFNLLDTGFFMFNFIITPIISVLLILLCVGIIKLLEKNKLISWLMLGKAKTVLLLLILCLTNVSCIKQHNLYQGSKEEEENGNGNTQRQDIVADTDFFYPFGDETGEYRAEITLTTHTTLSEDKIKEPVIPPLKYNKSLLLMLTQDDCKQAAFSWTWAAIHGKPLSPSYYYQLGHLSYDDLPPDVYYLGKTLGSTDGAGNEVRFSFTTTLSPEWDWMNAKTQIYKGNTKEFYRFFMKSGLVWGDVKEMLNYGVGIAMHDMDIDNEVLSVENLIKHYEIAQNIIKEKLSGRGCKMLTKPSGHNEYLTAAETYTPLQTMASDNGETIYPAQLVNDLKKNVLDRGFYSIQSLKEEIEKQQQRTPKERAAINVGVHGTDTSWADFLLWLNDKYGKEGRDDVWMPNQEEFYEYNFHRIHSKTRITKVDEHTLKLTVLLSSEENFYYPSITVNLPGISMNNIASISSNDEVTGLSYANYENGIMLNIDCRKYLAEHAENFVKRYEANPTDVSAKADANYFVNMLKDSDKKTELKKRAE